MAAGRVIGQIQVTKGDIKVIGVDGSVRDPKYDGYMYENEQIISSDPNALFQIKFLALPEASAYDGIFRILADGSVIHGRDAMDSIASDESLQNILETAAGQDVGDLETAAGEGEAEAGSYFTPPNIVAESSVLGFSRGANGELGLGITEFGSKENVYDLEQAPPVITSPNVVVYDENGTDPVIQVTAESQNSVTYSISGLDSEHFNIDPASGLITFIESPDFENPKDQSADNEYNMYVTVTDSAGNYTTQLLSVSVNNVNEPVTAYDDVVEAVEDTILSSTVDLDANDYDVDGDTLSVVAGTFDTAQGGEIIINADGSYTYTPPENFNGVDSVSYMVTDGEFSDTGTLTINVAPANDAPVAVDDEASLNEDASATVIDVLSNDTDLDADTLSVTAVTQPLNGVVTLVDGVVRYIPNANYNGPDSFTYTISDGAGGTDTATVSLTVNPVNDAPVAVDDVSSLLEDGSVLIDVVANDTDIDGTIDPTTVVITTQPLYGSVSVNPVTGVVTYTPNADYYGNDSFTYTVQDNSGATSSPATVSLTVSSVDDGPTIDVTSVAEITEDSVNSDTVVASFVANDIDNDNSLMTYEITAGSDPDSYYRIDGTDVKLTAAGAAYVNGGGEDLPDVSITVTSNGLSASDSDLSPVIIPAADPLVVYEGLGTIGEPLFDLADFELGDDPDFINGVSTTYSSNGLVLSADAPLNLNPGHGVGIDTAIDGTQSEALNIDGRYNESLNVDLPSAVYALNIDLKLTRGDLIDINLYDENGDEITSGITFKDADGNVLALNGDGYINGDDLSNGGDTIRITSDVKFDSFDITDANADAQDGFSLINIYDPLSIAGGYYTYAYDMDLILQEVDESVQSVTVSGFDDTSTKMVFTYSDGTQEEYLSDADGNITIDDADLLADVVDGGVSVTIAAQTEMAEGFQPAFDAVTIESDTSVPVAHTILGGSFDDILSGEDGNDYIDGREGSDTVFGGAGNDTIEYDGADTELDGGEGFDTLVGNAEVIDLANVSNMEVIELNSGTSVIGSSVDLGINASDVLSASGSGTLIIQSADGNALNQVNVDTTSLEQIDNVSIDGINYAQYSDGTATLLIELDDSIDVI